MQTEGVKDPAPAAPAETNSILEDQPAPAELGDPAAEEEDATSKINDASSVSSHGEADDGALAVVGWLVPPIVAAGGGVQKCPKRCVSITLRCHRQCLRGLLQSASVLHAASKRGFNSHACCLSI